MRINLGGISRALTSGTLGARRGEREAELETERRREAETERTMKQRDMDQRARAAQAERELDRMRLTNEELRQRALLDAAAGGDELSFEEKEKIKAKYRTPPQPRNPTMEDRWVLERNNCMKQSGNLEKCNEQANKMYPMRPPIQIDLGGVTPP